MMMTEVIGRIQLGDSASHLTIEDMFPVWKPKDLTNDVIERFFLPIPKGKQIAKASMCVIGAQGCGKSVLLESLSAVAEKKYGRENLHVIYTDDIRVALDLLNEQPVQLIIVDDAMTYASSRESSNQTAILKDYNRSRHVFSKIRVDKPGLILYIWAWQRYKELDISFRQSDITIFKTGISEKSERAMIEDYIGAYYQSALDSIWDKINRGDNKIKSTSIARINTVPINRGGAGYFRMQPIQTDVFPNMITHEEHFRDESTETDILDTIREKPEWRRRVEIYEMYSTGKYTQKEVAEKIGEQEGVHIRQGFVSESISKVKAFIESK